MSLYRITSNKLEPVAPTSFANESLLERKDLQRLLRQDIKPLGGDLMVIAEEFGDWDVSSRRIDLLCLSRDAALVVVEIKRTEDGGHMDLQAVRYAAMVSAMTLDQVVQAYAKAHSVTPEEAQQEILGFMGPFEDDETQLTGEVRIILAAANFSTEVTTAVLWLNRHDLDITCIRLRPYRYGADVFVDATQIIPLPEAADYAVKVKAQELEKRKAASEREEILKRFWAQFIERSRSRTNLFANKSPTDDHWLSAALGRSGFDLNTVVKQQESLVECYIRIGGDRERSLGAFSELKTRRTEIETAFGAQLFWEDLPGRKGCRISYGLTGGWKLPEAQWPNLQDRLIEALIRLEGALKKLVLELKP